MNLTLKFDVFLRSGKGYGLTLSAVDVGDLLLRVFRTLRDHRVKLDANFASVILAIMILEGERKTFLGKLFPIQKNLILYFCSWLVLWLNTGNSYTTQSKFDKRCLAKAGDLEKRIGFTSG